MKLQNKHFMIAKTPLYAAFFVFVSVLQNRVSACIKIAIPPLPHVFPLPPFPLFANLREPTASAPRGDTLGTRIDRDISLLMPPSFVRRLRNNMAQSDGTIVKLGARYGRRLATPIPSSNRHIPCIRTLRIGWNIPQPHQTNKRQRNALL